MKKVLAVVLGIFVFLMASVAVALPAAPKSTVTISPTTMTVSLAMNVNGSVVGFLSKDGPIFPDEIVRIRPVSQRVGGWLPTDELWVKTTYSSSKRKATITRIPNSDSFTLVASVKNRGEYWADHSRLKLVGTEGITVKFYDKESIHRINYGKPGYTASTITFYKEGKAIIRMYCNNNGLGGAFFALKPTDDLTGAFVRWNGPNIGWGDSDNPKGLMQLDAKGNVFFVVTGMLPNFDQGNFALVLKDGKERYSNVEFWNLRAADEGGKVTLYEGGLIQYYFP